VLLCRAPGSAHPAADRGQGRIRDPARHREEQLMAVLDTVLDITPAYGWQGGPCFNTRITPLRNGHERRNANWDQVKHQFTLPFQNITDAAYLAGLKSVFLAVRGQTRSFLAKDWSDYKATGESLGNAPSGTTAVQLQKVATFGTATY